MPGPPPIRAQVTAGRHGRLETALEEARAAFAAAVREGDGGLAAHHAYCDRFDALIRSIVDEARPLARNPLSVVALGGYGRRALCLHSDIDLLVVIDGRITRAEERFIKALLHPLWDLKLEVGHQVRTVADFDELERDNPLFLLALQDARPLAGDPGVLARAMSGFERTLAGGRDEMVEVLLGLIDERYDLFNDTVYQLEPDLKDAPGGLRDVVAVRLLGSLHPPVASCADPQRVELAEDFLMRLRSVVHFEVGRNVNLLTHELQEIAAERLRAAGRTARQRVEALMGEYFRHARTVAVELAKVRRRLRPAAAGGEHEALGDRLVLGPEGVGFADPERAAASPGTWLEAIEVALERGVALAPETLELFERGAQVVDTELLLSEPRAAARLVAALRPRRGLYARLSELHDCGLLERFFPELEAISNRVIRDFFHKYTVDEHTLLTVRGIERLVEPEEHSRARFGSILAELKQPELLVLALLYHDVGKWRDEEHELESTRMAQGMLDRLAIRGEARATVEFLISRHLEMSVVAFRRDTEEPSVVRAFARLVGKEEHLKMLCLMTLADVGAVSPETLTPWREELLWRLYVDAYNQLTLGYGDEVIERGQAAFDAVLQGRPEDLDPLVLTTFLEGLPQRYLALFDAETVYLHARLARDIRPDDLHLFLERKAEAWELTVATLDRPFLFSNLCGVLSYFGMDILRGSAMTGPSGLVLDVFQFTDAGGFLRMNKSAVGQMQALLREVVAGKQDIAELLARRESGLLRPQRYVEPIVRFDQGHSERYTVLEIVAQDAPALLHRVSRAISRHGCDVDLVLISTEGDRAIDVFHLTQAGAQLSEAAQRALKEDLEAMLRGRS